MTQTDTQIADQLQATVEGTAPKMRGTFGDLRTTTAIERRADLLNDLIAQLSEPVAITPAARAAYQLITAHDHEFDSDDDGADARAVASDYLADAESTAYVYEQAYREARRDGYWSADDAADIANDESGLAAATDRAHDAILLLAAALRTAPGPDDDPSPSDDRADTDARHSWQPSTERSECAECSAPLSARNWCSACRAVCWRCADDLTEHWTDGRGDALHTAHARARAVAAGWLSSEQRQRSPSYTRPRIAWTMHPVPSTTDDPEDDPPPSSPRPRRQTVREQAPSAEQWQAIVEARGCSTDADAPRCPECGSADIGRGSITGDPFCRECRSSAIAGADGVWAGVGRQLRRMAAAADANRAARIAAVAPIEAEAVALDDDAPPVWQPNPPQQQQAKPTAPSDDRPARLQQAADDIARTSPETAAVLLELADTDPAERVEAVHYRTTRAAAPLDGWIVSCGRVAADTDSSADPDAVSCAGCILVLDAAEQLPPRLELVAARIERDTALDDFRAVNAPYVARRDRDEAIDPSEQAAVVNPARERWQAAIRRVEAARVAAAEQRAAPGPSRAQANAAVKATDARMQAEADYRRARLVDDLDQDAQPRYPEDLTPTQQRRADASDRLWSARDREAGAARRLRRQRRAAAQQ